MAEEDLVTTQELRSDLQHGTTANLRRRRLIAGFSLAAMAGTAASSLLQIGIVKHLPDPPLKGFNSDKVNLSATAFRFGVPDGTIAMLTFAVNLPIAGFGGANRERSQPWVPLAAAAKAALDALVAGWYVYQEPTKEQAWCTYCLVGALSSFAILALTLPEAKQAVARLRSH